jgi:transposase
VLQEVEDGPTARADGSGVGATGAAAALRQAGKPRKDDRLVINGILWKLATGAPGGVLPERSGPWQSVDTRYRRWRRAGIWDGMLAAVQPQADAAGALDWAVHFVDGTVIRAHQHAAGAKGGRGDGSARP